jgi:hypothetical protein
MSVGEKKARFNSIILLIDPIAFCIRPQVIEVQHKTGLNGVRLLVDLGAARERHALSTVESSETLNP